ncbi:hypothetical protein CUMW_211540 [Citrus unshiu]|nr:hypothetical protein CUMW_211540 [Citrus unshiu]
MVRYLKEMQPSTNVIGRIYWCKVRIVINQLPCLKVDCKALLHVKRNSCGKWYVQNFIKEHIHELYPSHAHDFACHRSIAFSNKHSINMLHAVRVGTN